MDVIFIKLNINKIVDRRLDTWLGEEEVFTDMKDVERRESLFADKEGPVLNNSTEANLSSNSTMINDLDDSKAPERKMTRQRKRRLDEFNHVSQVF